MTRDDIARLLEVNDRAVARALVVLYQRQTADERSGGMTKHSNGCGFNASDAPFASSLAERVLGGKRLSATQLRLARRMLRKYAGQLLAVAEAKAASKEAPRPTP